MATNILPTDMLAPLPAVAARLELNESVRNAFVELCGELLRHAVARNQQWSANSQMLPPSAMAPRDIDCAFRYLASGEGATAETCPMVPREFGWCFDEKI